MLDDTSSLGIFNELLYALKLLDLNVDDTKGQAYETCPIRKVNINEIKKDYLKLILQLYILYFFLCYSS